jgi:hypothetical protein
VLRVTRSRGAHRGVVHSTLGKKSLSNFATIFAVWMTTCLQGSGGGALRIRATITGRPAPTRPAICIGEEKSLALVRAPTRRRLFPQAVTECLNLAHTSTRGWARVTASTISTRTTGLTIINLLAARIRARQAPAHPRVALACQSE